MTKLVQKKDENQAVIYKIDRSKRIGAYNVLPTSSQFKYCKKVHLKGFDHLPAGFYTRKGFGLSGIGQYLLQSVSDKYHKNINLTVVSKGRHRLVTKGRSVALTLPHNELSDLNASVRYIKRQKNEQILQEVRRYLGASFPRQFPKVKVQTDKYVPGALSKLIAQNQTMAKLSLEDRRSLESFIPDYLSQVEGSLRAKKKLKIVLDTVNTGRKVYLEKVVAEFKERLAAPNRPESSWQTFLSSHILILRNAYSQVLEKKSVSLEGKFPDFMLVDPYGYLDIYEIKTPSTQTLNLDKSRSNFYWSIELSKAISQVENYLHQVERHSDSLANDIRNSKGLQISIVRPRGYIIAGVRRQLTSVKMRNDFRILNDSLKNVDVIFYDDLINSLIAFLEKVS